MFALNQRLITIPQEDFLKLIHLMRLVSKTLYS